MALTLYRRMLRLLPPDFRRDYGDEMCRVVEEHWRAVRQIVGPRGALRFWTRQFIALARAALASRREVRRGIRPTLAEILKPRKRDWGGTMDGMGIDVRHSVRSLAKRPVFSAIAAATLGLGIGASTSIFSAVNAVLFRALPYAEPDRVVAVFHENSETGERGGGLSAANARDLMESSEHLTAVAVADPWSLDLQVDGRAESLRGWNVSEGFFEALGANPHLGRTFASDEYLPDSEAVVILSYRSWLGRFGGGSDVVGSVLTLDGQPMTVVGVLAPDFKVPNEGEVWIPRAVQPYDGSARAADYMLGVARLAPGSSLVDAQADARRIGAFLAESFPDTNATTTFRLVPLREYLFGDVRTPLLVLLGAVGFVLLIACANVAGLMLARGADRQREYAVRSALGASSGRLMWQVTVDSMLLAVLGCLLGIGLAFAGIQVIRGLAPEHLPRIEEISVDRSVLLFAVLVSGLSAFLSSIVPSLRLSRPQLRDALTDGSRSATAGPGGIALRNGIVVAEVAAAMVLVAGAGLLTRSFAVLLDESLGFEPQSRLALQVFAYDYGDGTDDAQTRAQFVNQAVEEMEALPGVRKVALTTNLPGATDGALAAIDIDLPFTIVDRAPPPEGHEPEALVSSVSHSFFEVLGILLRSGRLFTETDDSDAPLVVVVNETLVRRHFPDVDPIGQKLSIGFRPQEREIVGVVSDVRPSGYESEPPPSVYFPLRQQPSPSLTFVVHAERDAAQLTNSAKEAIWRANPAQSIWGAATLESLLSDWLKERRFNLVLLGSFAVIALALAAIGIYGLISFSVEQRVSELGIRRALGGRSGTIVGMVLREATLLGVGGVVLGVIGAVAMTRFIQGMLFGVEATDPATFAVLGVTVLAVALLAALQPALRATRVEPIVALRSD